MPNLTNPLATTDIGDEVHRQDPMIAIIVVAICVVQRHAPTDLAPMILKLADKRLDRFCRGAIGVLQKGAYTSGPALGFLTHNVLPVCEVAALIEVVEVVVKIAQVGA